jgi:hypothetical protein
MIANYCCLGTLRIAPVDIPPQAGITLDYLEAPFHKLCFVSCDISYLLRNPQS